MREEAYKQNSRIKPDSAEFAVIELGTGRLVGFGGLFDITRALVATMFVGIGEAAMRRKGYGTEASRLICEYGFFFEIFTASRWKCTPTMAPRGACTSASVSKLLGACAVPTSSTIVGTTR